jgi:hypothetical protein
VPGLKPTQTPRLNDDVGREAEDASCARVQFATRYLPAFNAFGNLGKVRTPNLRRRAHPPESVYLTGRNIGDEYRYVPIAGV